MKFFGIQKPVTKTSESYVSWIGISECDSWNRFFGEHPHRFPLIGAQLEARKAYEAIGYRCVELECWIERFLPTVLESESETERK